MFPILLAPRAGFEPATNRLTAGCSTTELPGNNPELRHAPITKLACFAKHESPTSLSTRQAVLCEGCPRRPCAAAKGGGHGRNRTGVHGFAVQIPALFLLQKV